MYVCACLNDVDTLEEKVCNKSNTTGATNETGIAYTSGAYEFPPPRFFLFVLRSDDFNLTTRNTWFSNFFVNRDALSRKS
jgi:hypothetical protein